MYWLVIAQFQILDSVATPLEILRVREVLKAKILKESMKLLLTSISRVVVVVGRN